MTRPHGVLGEFLLDKPISFLHPKATRISEAVFHKPIFDSGTELLGLMGGTVDKSGIYKVLAGEHFPGAITQSAIESAIRKKLAASPKTADFLIGQMSSLVQVSKHWPKDASSVPLPSLAASAHEPPLIQLSSQITELQRKLAEKRAKEKPITLSKRAVKKAIAVLQDLGVNDDVIERIQERKSGTEFLPSLDQKVAGPDRPGVKKSDPTVTLKKDSLRLALLVLTLQP